MVAQTDSLREARVHLRRGGGLVAHVHLPKLLQEEEYRALQVLIARAIAALTRHVGDVDQGNKLQNHTRQLAVDELLRLSVRVRRQVRSEDLPNDVNEPRELALALREPHLHLGIPRALGDREGECLLVEARRRLKQREHVRRDLL